MRTYDLAQTAELIAAMRGTRFFVPVLLAVLCGLRRGEVAALRWGQVDLTTGQLSVTQSAEQTRAGVRYKEPKSGRPRTVALSETVIEELRAYRIKQAQELLRLGLRVTEQPSSVLAKMASRYGRTPLPTTGNASCPRPPCPAFAFTTCAMPMQHICYPAAFTPRWRANAWGTRKLESPSTSIPTSCQGCRPMQSLALTKHCALP